MALKCLLVLALWMLFPCAGAKAQPFEAGAAVFDITPPVGFVKYGYPREASTGIKDPLLAKALVFVQGDTQGALLVCDLLGIPRDLSRIVREQASSKTGIPFANISVSATHTHTSPGLTEEFREFAVRYSAGKLTGEDRSGYFFRLVEGMTEAIVTAFQSRQATEIISGKGHAPGIAFNRRYLMTDGRVRFNPGRANPRIVRPAGPTDPSVPFVFFKQAGESGYMAALTSFSSHYVRGGNEFSADYPFYLSERFRQLYGSQLISVFGIGACGNVNAVDVHGPADKPDEKVQAVGTALADAVNAALPDVHKGLADLGIASRVIYLPLQDYTEEELLWSKEGKEPLYPERDFLVMRRRMKISLWGVQPPLEQLRKHEAVVPAVPGDPWRLPVEIQVFRLNSETAVVTMPGELFVEFGLDLKSRSPFTNTILIELANADIAYIPTLQAFEEGDYEPVNSRLAPGSGEIMVEVALQMLRDLKK